MLRRTFLRAVALALAALGLLTGCDLLGRNTPAPTVTAIVGNSTPVAGGEAGATTTALVSAAATPTARVPQGGDLTIRVAAPLERLTPWDIRSRGEEHATQLLFNGLMRLDERLQPQTDLAETLEIAPSNDVLTFTVRSGLRWHDNKPLTSDDVVWTLNTLRTLTPTNALLYDLRTVIGEVRSPITGTVVLSLTQAYAPMLAALAVPVLPRHLLQTRSTEQLTALDFLQVAGSGPFRFGSRDETSLTLLRNDGYLRGRPNLERVILREQDDAGAQAALADGTLLVAEFPTATTGLTLTGRLQAGRYAENGSYWLAFNVRAGRIFSDTVVRQALAQAVDLPAVIRQATGTRGVPLLTSLPPGVWSDPNTQPAAANVEQARQLLEGAGWTLPTDKTVRERNGVVLQTELFVRGDDARRVAVAQAIAAAAAEIGIALTVAPIEFDPTLIEKLAPPYEFDLLLGSWVNAPNTANFPTNRFYDPDDSALFGSDRIYSGDGDTRTGLRNIGGYRNEAYDAAARQARSIFDPQARLEAIRVAQEIVATERPYLFLWSDAIPVVVSTQLRRAGGAFELSNAQYLNDVETWYLMP